MDQDILTLERIEKRIASTAKSQGFGYTDGANAIVDRYLNVTHSVINSKLEHNGDELSVIMGNLGADTLTLIALHEGLSSVASVEDLSKTLFRLGAAVSYEAYGRELNKYDHKLAGRIEKVSRKRHSSLRQRRQAVRSLAKRAGFKWKHWTGQERIRAGTWLLNAMLETPVFVLSEDNSYVTITEEALSVAHEFMAELYKRSFVHLPLLTQPEPWADLTRVINGQEVQFVRDHSEATHAIRRRFLRDGAFWEVFKAVNIIESVPWNINTHVLDLVQWAYEEDIGVPGLPHKSDLPMPLLEKQWDDMTENEQRLMRKRRHDVKQANRGFTGERMTYVRDIETAKWIGSASFWVPHNVDYRGRIYGVSHFNFQRQDYVRAMFEFANKQMVTPEGMYWLKVHVANTGDFGKISKATFDQRVEWVEDNLEMLLDVATKPKETVSFWSGADAPFQFVAACRGLYDALRGKPIGIPASFDGTCSGLQHLCAMTRAPEGILVNLGPTERPNDIYQVVADRAKAKFEADLDNEEVKDYAKLVLDYGVTRSLVKRNVMTYSYSSKVHGMAGQHREDTMAPLALKVLLGDLKEHPFGEDGGFKAAHYIARVIYGTIEEVITLPAKAMAFLQRIARACAHEGKPVIWKTPLGFPVVMRYPNMGSDKVSLWLSDHGHIFRIQPRVGTEKAGIDKSRAANAIAPGFVHSMDACHLQMAVLHAYIHGIPDVALVHDSFGCHPNDADEFRRVILQTFISMYLYNDVLREIKDEVADQLDSKYARLPEDIEYGSLDIYQIKEAKYAFA